MCKAARKRSDFSEHDAFRTVPLEPSAPMHAYILIAASIAVAELAEATRGWHEHCARPCAQPVARRKKKTAGIASRSAWCFWESPGGNASAVQAPPQPLEAMEAWQQLATAGTVVLGGAIAWAVLGWRCTAFDPPGVPREWTPLRMRVIQAGARGAFLGLDIGGTLSKLIVIDPGTADARSPACKRVVDFVTAHQRFGLTGKRDEHLALELGDGAVIHLLRFHTRRMPGALALARSQLETCEGVKGAGLTVDCTGGGSRKFAGAFAREASLTLRAHDELECLVGGLIALLRASPDDEAFALGSGGERMGRDLSGSSAFPFIVANVGSGVSIVLVESPDRWRRVSGTPIGGGTFFGLVNLITGLTSFSEMLSAAAKGDHTAVNLTVGDIYGDSEGVYGLRPDHIAANFGKPLAARRMPGDRAEPATSRRECGSDGAAAEADSATPPRVRSGSFHSDGRFHARTEDVCRAALVMVTDQVAQAAVMSAKHHGVRRVLFAGSFLRHGSSGGVPQERLSWAIDAWSGGEAEAIFLKREGYNGALGALLASGDTCAS